MKYTDKQIKEWKEKYGDLFEVVVEDKSCLFRKPTRKDYSYVSAIKDPIKMTEMLAKQLWVAGDKEMIDNDDYFLSLIPKMDVVMKTKDAEVKKL